MLPLPAKGESFDLSADYRDIFNALPVPSLVIEPPDFVMVAANEARLRVTNTRREDIIGRKLFCVFPDNPEDPEATGVANLRASLARVLATRRADYMAIQKYDIPRPEGGFEERWWSPRNIPVLGANGAVSYIIHLVEDSTAAVWERQRAADAEAGEARLRELADAIPGWSSKPMPRDGTPTSTSNTEPMRAFRSPNCLERVGSRSFILASAERH